LEFAFLKRFFCYIYALEEAIPKAIFTFRNRHENSNYKKLLK